MYCLLGQGDVWMAKASVATQGPRAESAMPVGVLGAIRAVTLTASDLAAAEAAWVDFMGYRVVRRGVIARETAEAWAAPALVGKRVLVLGPESGEPTYLRFVEQPTPGDNHPRHGQGWTVTELTVRDSDRLNERLAQSPFTVTGPPRTVPTYEYLRAMQATGPAGEHLNLTWITETRPDLAVAKCFVDRCFIAVLGAEDLPTTLDFYRATFGNAASPIRQLPQFKLAVIVLKDGCKIEVDEQPGSPARPRAPGGLPPGLAMVSFECSDFERFTDRLIGPPALVPFGAQAGRRSGVMPGAAGELIELIET